MYFILTEDVETIGYKKNDDPVGLYLTSGSIFYKPKRDPEWFTYKYYLKDEEYNNYISKRNKKPKKVYRLLKVSSIELGDRARPVSPQDDFFKQELLRRRKNLKRKHPTASDKQIENWLWNWSMGKMTYQNWGAEVQNDHTEWQRLIDNYVKNNKGG